MRNLIKVKNPYTQSDVGYVDDIVPKHASDLVSKFLALKNEDTGFCEKLAILRRFGEELIKNRETLEVTVTDETGMSRKDAGVEFQRLMNTLRACEHKLIHLNEEQNLFDSYPNDNPSVAVRCDILRRPYSAVLAISPFNHPLNLVAHKVLPAILAGTRVVLKPSPKTPLSAQLPCTLLFKAGLCPKRLLLITSSRCDEVVKTILHNNEIPVITFTGSTKVGVGLGRSIARSRNIFCRFIPEMGGVSPFIVDRDVDVNRAVQVATRGAFANAGQRCTAIRSIYVNTQIYDVFLAKFIASAESLAVGDPYESTTDIGTLISKDSAINIQKQIKGILKSGAELLAGGRYDNATFHPTILSMTSIGPHVVPEIFGPVVIIYRYEEIDEVVHHEARNPYKLAAGIMTNDQGLAVEVSDTLGVGQFNINAAPGFRFESAPFGGYGSSGNGNKEGVFEMTRSLQTNRTIYFHD